MGGLCCSPQPRLTDPTGVLQEFGLRQEKAKGKGSGWFKNAVCTGAVAEQPAAAEKQSAPVRVKISPGRVMELKEGKGRFEQQVAAAVGPECTAQVVKERIALEIGVSTGQQELWFNGQPIESQVTLSSEGVQPGDCLHLSVCSWILEALKLVALSQRGLREAVLLNTLRHLGYTGVCILNSVW